MIQEKFKQQFEEAINSLAWEQNSLIYAKVLDIGKDFITLDAKLKSEGLVPTVEFREPNGEINVNIGDEVQVVLEEVDNGYGETLLSRSKAKRLEAWRNLIIAHEKSAIVIGKVTGRVKGGFTVEIGEIKAFLPGSLVDVKPVKDPYSIEGETLEFKVLKIDQKRNNVVVSRKAVLSADQNEEKAKLLSQLEVGLVVQGIVKNLTDYGAFVDLGGVDGLLHITDMSWNRVSHPEEVTSVGEEIQVKILKYDKEKTRVSLGLKQLQGDPWNSIIGKYEKGMKLKGNVSNFTDYGCFVSLSPGIEGLVHISEIAWSNKNQHPSKIYNIGDEVEVMILDVDYERRRLSLGIKQCMDNPWKKFLEKHVRGDIVQGEIFSITDFGIFLRLTEGIDGLIHISDLTWTGNPENEIKKYHNGDVIKAFVLQVDLQRERISLGLKQLEKSPSELFYEINPKGSNVSGVIKEIDVNKGICQIQLTDHVIAEINLTDLNNVVNNPNIGDKVDLIVLDLSLQGLKLIPVILLESGIDKKDIKTKISNDKTTNANNVQNKPENAITEALRRAKLFNKEDN